MKGMHVVLAAFCLLFVSVANVDAQSIKERVKGKWDLNVPSAPAGYDKYEAEFKEKDGGIVMDIRGGDFVLRDQKFIERDGRLVGTLNVGEPLQLIIFVEDGVLKGTADSSMGKMPFTMKKKQ